MIRWREKRGGVWYPEDRLRASLIPFAVVVPIPVLAFGVINQYVDGRPGLIGCLICLFLNGLGVSANRDNWQCTLITRHVQIEMAFGPCAAYLVDVMHSRSAESLAANGWVACSYARFVLRGLSHSLKRSAIRPHGSWNSYGFTYDQYIRDCGYECPMHRFGLDLIRVRPLCSVCFFSCHPDIDVVYQDPLLYHPVWGSYESVLRCWFFDPRD